MQLKNKKIVFLYTGGHSVHIAFAKSIGADIQKLSWNVPKNYDIYISEGDYKILPTLKIRKKIPKKSKIINLFSDPRLFYLNNKIKFTQKKIKKENKIKLAISKFLIKKFNGFITVGNFETDLLRKICSNKPILTTLPFISNKRVKELSKIKPKLKNKEILFIGNGPNWHYKGLDLLLEVFKELKKEDSSYSLKIIGNWKKSKNIIPGVKFLGIKNNISKYLKESSLYLHLARGEAFGVTIMESMISGIPIIIARDIGAREIVEKVDTSLITSYKKKEIIKKVQEYFNKTQKEKQNLGIKLKKEGKKLNEKDMLKIFKQRFEKLLGEIYAKRKN